MKNIITTFFVFITFQFFGQNEWESWDKNYKETIFLDVCNLEKQYADSIEKNKEIAQYYSRLDKYKITAKYLGKSQRIDPEVLHSMKNVYKLFVGNPDQLDGKVKNEFLFEIAGYKIWLPIQEILEKPLKKEIKVGTEIILYCLFLNEHTQNGQLYNTFFISEFR